LCCLLKYDQDFNILPDLAESYTSNGPVFTFKIRKGATWSDGIPLKAQDFVYSLRRQIDPRTGNGYGSSRDHVVKGAFEYSTAKVDDPKLDKLGGGVGVSAPDDNTFVVTGDAAYGLIPAQTAFVAATVAREDQVKKFMDSKGVSSWTDPGKTGAPVLGA